MKTDLRGKNSYLKSKNLNLNGTSDTIQKHSIVRHITRYLDTDMTEDILNKSLELL